MGEAAQLFLPRPLLQLDRPLLASRSPALVATLLTADQLLDVLSPPIGRLGHIGEDPSEPLVPAHHLLVVGLQDSGQGRA